MPLIPDTAHVVAFRPKPTACDRVHRQPAPGAVSSCHDVSVGRAHIVQRLNRARSANTTPERHEPSVDRQILARLSPQHGWVERAPLEQE